MDDLQAIASQINKWAVMSHDDSVHSAKNKYFDFCCEILAINTVFVDQDIDCQNAIGCGDKNTVEFWEAMLSSAINGAGSRAEERGFNINELIGRQIY